MNKSRLAAQCDEIFKLVAAGESCLSIARRIGATPEGVRLFCMRRGVDSRVQSRVPRLLRDIEALAAKGMTRDEIAAQLGITRSYAGILAKRAGVEVPAAVRRPRCRPVLSEAQERQRRMRKAYTSQKNQAARRGIGWLFDFEGWCAVWDESGRWDQRGKRIGQYVMARNGDTGPYHASNVSITGCGRGWTFVARAAKRPYQVTLAKKYIGSFATQQEAEAAYAKAVEEHKSAGHGSDCDPHAPELTRIHTCRAFAQANDFGLGGALES